MPTHDEIEKLILHSCRTSVKRGGIESLKVDSVLWGYGGIVDSIGLITMLFELEFQIKKHYSKNLNLVSEEILLRSPSPLATIRNLAQFVLEQWSAK